MYFEKPVAFSLNFDGTVAPVGFSGPVKKMDVIGSARVERAVDRITSDTDVAATDAAVALMGSDVDVYQIAKLMTAGLLGKRRTFVPTRWAITAVDDTLSTSLKKEIARFPPIEEIRVFAGEIYGNRIVCILVPGDWKYEMIEIWGKQTLWAGDEEVIVQDREGMTKRRVFPDLRSVLLCPACGLRISQKYPAVCPGDRGIRSVSSEYWAPLGTWVIREATRKAMANPPVPCPSLDAAVRQAAAAVGSDTWVPHSTLIPELRTQRTLFQF